MDYIIMGVLIGLGWQLVRLVFGVIEELLFTRLHKAKWYAIAAGKQPRNDNSTGVIRGFKNKIGF